MTLKSFKIEQKLGKQEHRENQKRTEFYNIANRTEIRKIRTEKTRKNQNSMTLNSLK